MSCKVKASLGLRTLIFQTEDELLHMLDYLALHTLMSLSLIVILPIVLALVWFWKPLRIDGLPNSWMLVSFIVKCAAGILIWYLYAHHLDIDRKDADIFKYFDDAQVMYSSYEKAPSLYLDLFTGREDPVLEPYFEDMYNWNRSFSLIQINDNRSMIRVQSLIYFLSRGNIHVHTVIFSFLSFIGLVFLFKGMRRLKELPPWLFVVACILPPSLLLWGSGLLKETLVILPLGLSIYGATGIYKGKKSWPIMFLGLLLFLGIKPYVLVAVLPVLIYLLIRRSTAWNPWVSLGSSFGISVLGLGVSSFIPKMDVIGVLALKRKDFVQVAEDSGAGSTIDIPAFSSFLEFLMYAPGAAVRTLFRPWLWEMSSTLEALAAAENSIYILLLLLALWFRRKGLDDMFMISLIFVLSLSVLVGSVTPVLGAIVRYKSPALPFLIFGVFALIDMDRLKKYRLT